jgi:TRAP-type C4-dicarboxylate transport system substrate-binding protein
MQLPSRKLAALLTALGLALTATPAAQAVDIKLGHVLAASHSWHKAAEGFAAEVKEFHIISKQPARQ